MLPCQHSIRYRTDVNIALCVNAVGPLGAGILAHPCFGCSDVSRSHTASKLFACCAVLVLVTANFLCNLVTVCFADSLASMPCRLLEPLKLCPGCLPRIIHKEMRVDRSGMKIMRGLASREVMSRDVPSILSLHCTRR